MTLSCNFQHIQKPSATSLNWDPVYSRVWYIEPTENGQPYWERGMRLFPQSS